MNVCLIEGLKNRGGNTYRARLMKGKRKVKNNMKQKMKTKYRRANVEKQMND